MKSITRHLSAAVFAAALLPFTHAFGQTQLAGWNVFSVTTNGGGASPAPFASTSFATNYVTAGNLVKGTNPGPAVVASETEVYGGNDWYSTNESEANSISNGFYIAYSVVANPGYSLSFTTNFLSYHNSATGPTNGALQYCTDGVSYSNIFVFNYAPYDTAETTTTNINLSTNGFLQNIQAGVTNYFRLVNWGTVGTGTAGTWYVEGNSVLTNAGLQLIGSVQTELAGWNVGGVPNDGGGAPPAPYNATYTAPNITASPLTKGSTPGPGVVTTEDGVYGGNDWFSTTESETNSIANGYYIEYSIVAASGFFTSFSNNFLYWHNSATGPTNGALQYCTDGVSYSNIFVFTYAPYDTGETTTTNINLSTNTFLQNITPGTTNYFRLVNWGTEGTGTAGTWYVESSGSISAGLQLTGTLISTNIIAPSNLVVTPSNAAANAGGTVTFTVSATGSQPSYTWYDIQSGATNPITGADLPSLTLTSLFGSNAGSYFVVLSNASGVATSPVVSLTVQDPFVTVPPNNAEGFLGGVAQFSATAEGTSPSFAWYQNNGSVSWTAVTNGLQPSGSTVYGQGTDFLSISNVQMGDVTNFAGLEVVVANGYSSVTTYAVSLLEVSASGPELAGYVFNGVLEVTGTQDGLPNSGIIAQWDFNGVNFTNPQLNPPPYTGVYNPASPAECFPPPWIGVGTCTAVGNAFDPGTSPYNGAGASGGGGVAATDGQDYTTNLPNGAFGTENYPLVGGNKENGVQFLTSTAGAKNIQVSYYVRETGTSSLYTRLQYTTNSGGDWTDYPTSSSFPASDVNLYAPIYTYDLSGFPGAANNPDFGIRIVTEFQNTATYGIGSQGGNPLYITNGYVGADNLYSSGASATASAGTLTFDLVTIGGQPFGEPVYSPPTISPITNVNALSAINTLTLNSVAEGESNYDYVVISNAFTIGSAIMPVGELTVSAQSLAPNNITFQNISFTSSNNGSNITMFLTPESIAAPFAAAPILVTVTDTNGDTAQEWFLLTLQSLNLPPTNTLVSVTATNMLANSTLNIPFIVGSYDGTNTSPPVSYASNSANNTIIPTGNLALTGEGTTNLVFSITPAHNELGEGVVSVTVNDGNPLEPRYTTATIPIMVRPNTNVILIDYFNYDSSGPLEVVSANYWSHLTGNEDQIQVGNGLVPNSATLDTLDDTETLQAPLLGAPYNTNSGGTLYASFILTMADPSKMPVNNGGYLTAFNDGSGNTGAANLECGLWIQTNGAAHGHYRLGITDFPAQEGAGVTYPQDLTVGTGYVVVAALNLSNASSTLWINPVSQASFSVTDTTSALQALATNYNIKEFELHEGIDDYAGSASISTLKVGTTFDSVFPSLHLQVVGTNAVVTWSDPTLGIQYSPDLVTPWTDITNATSPYTNALNGNTEMYFKFGQ